MSHVLRAGVADQIAYFRAYNTDGSAKTDLTSSTTGLTLSVFRIGASSVSIASLSNKAADDTAHSDGAIRNVGGNLYTVDIPDAATATQVPSIVVRGSYTGGVIEGLEHPITGYDPSVNYGTNAQSVDIQSRLPTTLDNGLMRSSVQKSSSDIAGVVTNSEAPTVTMFSTNLDYYDTTFDRMIIRFTSGSLVGASHIIESYINTDGKVTVAEPFALAPEVDDEFVILTNSQVHPVATITDAVWAKDISGATAGTAGAYLKDIWGRVTAAVYTMWTNLIAMITGTGASASFTTKAMENASVSAAVYPTQLQAEDRNVEGPIKIYTGESGEQFFHAIDANQDPIDLTGVTLELRFGDSLTKNVLYTAKTSDGTIVVSNQNKVTFTKSVRFTRFEMSTLRFSLRDMDAGDEVILTGPVKLSWAP